MTKNVLLPFLWFTVYSTSFSVSKYSKCWQWEWQWSVLLRMDKNGN